MQLYESCSITYASKISSVCKQSHDAEITILMKTNYSHVGLGGLGVTCSPLDPRFADSNPADVDEFFQDVKILSTSPPGETLSWGSRIGDFRLVKEPQA